MNQHTQEGGRGSRHTGPGIGEKQHIKVDWND